MMYLFVELLFLHSDISSFDAVVHPPLPLSIPPPTHVSIHMSIIHPSIHLSITVAICRVSIHRSIAVSIHHVCFHLSISVAIHCVPFHCMESLAHVSQPIWTSCIWHEFPLQIVGISVVTPGSCTIVRICDGYQPPKYVLCHALHISLDFNDSHWGNCIRYHQWLTVCCVSTHVHVGEIGLFQSRTLI